MSQSPADKRWAQRRGVWAEFYMARFLQIKGYQILDQRAAMPSCELDIVAQHGDTLCFVEVKAGRDKDQLLSRFHPAYQNRLIRASAQWRARRNHASMGIVRFDIGLVLGWTRICHMRGAFEANDALHSHLL